MDRWAPTTPELVTAARASVCAWMRTRRIWRLAWRGGRSTVILSGSPANIRVTSIDDAATTPLQPGRARVRVFNGTTSATPLDITVTPFNGTAQTQTSITQGTPTT